MFSGGCYFLKYSFAGMKTMHFGQKKSFETLQHFLQK